MNIAFSPRQTFNSPIKFLPDSFEDGILNTKTRQSDEVTQNYILSEAEWLNNISNIYTEILRDAFS